MYVSEMNNQHRNVVCRKLTITKRTGSTCGEQHTYLSTRYACFFSTTNTYSSAVPACRMCLKNVENQKGMLEGGKTEKACHIRRGCHALGLMLTGPARLPLLPVGILSVSARGAPRHAGMPGGCVFLIFMQLYHVYT